jgi:oxygen-independent coproporphyrinogen-3 oxidase
MPVELAERYATPVPRYTSYPTAPHFHSGIDDTTYRQWIAALPADASLSLYIHVPFCDRLCWFCGCHTKQIHRYTPVTKYLSALYAEIVSVSSLAAGRGKVVAIHLGGGSPSMLTPGDFLVLNTLLRDRFDVSDAVEFSIEIDPNDMDESRYDALARIGITRVSLGVQDFNPEVQAAINRIQTYEQTKAVVDAMRQRGVHSVNLDVLYGLPYQTVRSVEATARQALSLQPDRLAIFGYAHVPWLKTHQRMIEESALPGVRERFEQAQAAATEVIAAGYEAIGFDHFARPSDDLASAAREGRLHRNFQGYTVDSATALIGFGASAIGRLPQGYVQNTVATAIYQRQIEAGGTAIARGVALTDEDHIRSYAIERLLCDFSISQSDLRQRFGDLAEPVASEMVAVVASDTDGLTEFDGDQLIVTPRGRPFIRSIAASFDAYLFKDGARYSIAV